MGNDKFFKVMLVITALLLLCNLFSGQLSSLFAPEVAARDVVQRLDFRGNGVAIFSSSDGKYVYAASSQALWRSVDYGKSGSWEQVVTGRR